MKNCTNIALRVFNSEIETLNSIKNLLAERNSRFQSIVEEMLACKGKVIVTGMGKSGHIAQKIAASMASLGTPAFCLHPGEAMHGDLGMIHRNDLVIAISKSGESEEITQILPNINRIGAKLIGITSNADSALARSSHICEVFPPCNEACPLNLAPTSSTTAALVYGDALAVAAAEMRSFGKNDFALRHPAGSLGKMLILRVSDCMTKYLSDLRLSEDDTLSNAVAVLCGTTVSVIPVYSRRQDFCGTLSAKDVKNAISSGADIYSENITNLINADPSFISPDELAHEALRTMTSKCSGGDYMIVFDGDKAVGIVTSDNILEKGVYL